MSKLLRLVPILTSSDFALTQAEHPVKKKILISNSK